MVAAPNCKDWCFTVNGSDDEQCAWYRAMAQTPVEPEDQAQIKYIVMQCELASSQHIQGFVQFTLKQRLAGAKRLLCSHIQCPHLEPRKGTPVEASDYCIKDDGHVDHPVIERVQRGTMTGQGQRKDLEELAQSIVDRTASLSDIAQENPAQFVRYHRGLQALADTVRLPYSGGEKIVKVYYGPTGTGKTRKAFTENPEAYFWGPEQGKWFQGYSGQETTILDEYRGQLPFGFLLRLTDRYPMKIEFKGSSTEFVSSTIIICSPVHPLLWYPSLNVSEGKMDQMMRRISTIEWFGDEPEPPTPTPQDQLNFPQFG